MTDCVFCRHWVRTRVSEDVNCDFSTSRGGLGNSIQVWKASTVDVSPVSLKRISC